MTRETMREAFERFVPQGCVVMIHASLENLGIIDGGADTVIDAMLDALGPAGTLVTPTLTGHEALSAHNPPHIDLRTEPCSNGLVAETLRKRPEAIRSVHPTHSCAALGAEAEEVTRDHYLSPTPCGVTSPYFRVTLAEGYIVVIGGTLGDCTTFHAVEEIAGLDYPCQEEVAFGTCMTASATSSKRRAGSTATTRPCGILK